VAGMDAPFLALARRYRKIGSEVGTAVAGRLARGFYVLGSRVEAFEREFAAYCGAQHAVGVGSGTDALHLALRACGVRPDDRVITPPNTPVPTICAIVQAGGPPVLRHPRPPRPHNPPPTAPPPPPPPPTPPP